MQHSKHIWRAVIILVVLGSAAVSVRAFLLPASFGQAGHYRYDSIGEYMEKPVEHGGDESCKKCHEDQFKTHLAGAHAGVRCEVCHGPVMAHADPRSKERVKIADARVEKTFEWCGVCHYQLPSRPASFPQIDFLAHVNSLLAKEGVPPVKKLGARICILCHAPHNPKKEASGGPSGEATP